MLHFDCNERRGMKKVAGGQYNRRTTHFLHFPCKAQENERRKIKRTAFPAIRTNFQNIHRHVPICNKFLL